MTRQQVTLTLKYTDQGQKVTMDTLRSVQAFWHPDLSIVCQQAHPDSDSESSIVFTNQVVMAIMSKTIKDKLEQGQALFILTSELTQ
jgi:hypothetical protein